MENKSFEKTDEIGGESEEKGGVQEGDETFSRPESEGMKFFEGHPVCKECQAGIHNHNYSLEKQERADCKNIEKIEDQIFQCHCGFGGVYKDGKWQPWPED